MYDIALANGGAPATLWSAIAARQAVAQAADAVEAAAAQLAALVADAHWESDGVRTLRTRLDEMQSATGRIASQLHIRCGELDRVAAS